MKETSKLLFEKYDTVEKKIRPATAEQISAQQNIRMLLFVNYYYPYIKKHFGNNKNIRILEVGCGNGSLSIEFYKRGYHRLTGIDMCPEDIRFAQSRNKHIEYICGNAFEFLESSNEKFDLVYSKAVFEHIEKENVLDTVRLIKSKLNKGGAVIVDVPNMDWIWASHERYMDFTHECGFTAESLTEILRTEFEEVDTSYADTTKNDTFKQYICRYILHRLFTGAVMNQPVERLFSRQVIAFAHD